MFTKTKLLKATTTTTQAIYRQCLENVKGTKFIQVKYALVTNIIASTNNFFDS